MKNSFYFTLNKKRWMVYSLMAILLFGMAAIIPDGMQAQTSKAPIKISGTVIDKSGVTLPGASVTVKGTTNAVMTNADGAYTINVPDEKTVLVFSTLGFKTKEITVGTKRKIDAIIEEDNKLLDEVVVIGYGTSRKRDITGAIESVTAERIMEKSPINVFDALQGEVAGMEIVSGSGAPGDDAEVRIRGTSTFEGGAKPLYVVDGVPTDEINSINAADIESVEVLKDAASAAIYGSRSANGVILVTTKKGDRTNPKVNISYLKSFSQLTRKMPVANAAERKHYDEERYRISGGSYGYVITDSLALFNNQDNDLQDLIFRTASRDQIDLSASGGSSNFTYYASLGYLSDRGIIVNSKYDRITSRINGEYKPNNTVTIGSRINLSYSKNDGVSEDGVLNQLLQRPSYWAIFNADGSYIPNLNSRRNPYAVAMTDVNKKQVYRGSMYQYLTLDFDKRLKANISLQGNYINTREQMYRAKPQLATTERTTGRDYTVMGYDYANENYLTYTDKFGEFHEFNAMIGSAIQEWSVETNRIVGYDYASDLSYTLNMASEMDNVLTYTKVERNSLASVFGRVGYSYRSRYLANLNMRYDGSSRFGPNNRWGAFPSASVGWRFSDEIFTRWMKRAVNDAKLRLSWGITGNQEIGNYEWPQIYSASYIYNGLAGIAATNLAYDDLGWEKTTQYNVGLDLLMANSKLQVVFDAYWKNTDNLLATVQYPKETGFKTIRKNVGAMENKGVEFSVKYDIIRRTDLSLSANFNIATADSRIKKLADGTSFYRGMDDAVYIQEGARLGDFYGYKYLGIFQYDESNAFTDDGRQLSPVFSDGVFQNKYMLDGKAYTGNVNQKLAADGTPLKGGDVNFEDSDRNGQVNSADKRKIGNAQADFFGGFGFNAKYKRVGLTVGFAYSYGGDIYNYAESNRNRAAWDGATPSPDFIHNMWTKPGDIAKYPVPVPVINNRLAPSDFYVSDGSYVKLKNVRVTYYIPGSILKKIFVRNASVYAYGNNLLTFTKYKGYDPEFSTRTSSESLNIDPTSRDTRSSDPLSFGIDQNRYPRKREFGFGLNVTF